MITAVTVEQARLVSKVLNTSVQDADSTLRCDDQNWTAQRGVLYTIPALRYAIEVERAQCRPRVAMIAVLERAIRRRERLA